MLIIDTLGNGGAERQLSLLASGLSKSHDVMVLALGQGPFESVLKAAGIETVVLTRRHRADFRVAFRVGRLVGAWRPDVVHTWGWMSTLSAAPFCRARRIPLLDGSVRTGAYPLRRGIPMRLGQRLADTVVANSAAGLDAFGVGSRRGTVVPNGIDPSILERTAAAASANRPPGNVIMSARMVPEKDYTTFISAARMLLRSATDIDWTFTCIGDGPVRAELINQASDLIDVGAIGFPEPVLDVLPMLMRGSLGVLMNPKNSGEGCSNSLLEYMACGLPVVCSDTGGNAELVRHGETGIIIAPEDPAALAEAILLVSSDSRTAVRMSEAARARVTTQYSAKRMTAAYARIYSGLVRGGA